MKIAIFGASGRTGQHIVSQALQHGHTVNAFVRNRDKLMISDPDLEIIEGDAYTGENVVKAVKDVDTVISALRQTRNGPNNLLEVAGNNITRAMEKHEVNRFVTLVGAGVTRKDETRTAVAKISETLLKLISPEIIEDAEKHVIAVEKTDLDWTAVRAPRLNNRPGKEDYRTGDVRPGFRSVSAGDVAQFMLECVENKLYIRQLPKISY
jgi:putative NADH-flavin reductase